MKSNPGGLSGKTCILIRTIVDETLCLIWVARSNRIILYEYDAEVTLLNYLCFSLNMSTYWLKYVWIEGSTSCSSHIIFILTPNIFLWIHKGLDCQLAPFLMWPDIHNNYIQEGYASGLACYYPNNIFLICSWEGELIAVRCTVGPLLKNIPTYVTSVFMAYPLPSPSNNCCIFYFP